MNTKKEKLINRQKFIIRIFWTTMFFLFGFLFAVWQTYENTGYDVLKHLEGGLALIGLVLFIEILTIIIMFISIGKKEKPKSSFIIEQIEKLGKLKAQGLISEDEFEREKKKLWIQD